MQNAESVQGFVRSTIQHNLYVPTLRAPPVKYSVFTKEDGDAEENRVTLETISFFLHF